MDKLLGAIALIATYATLFCGWITHVFWFFGAVTEGEATAGTWFFFLLGLLAAPIGSLHGIWLWFN